MRYGIIISLKGGDFMDRYFELCLAGLPCLCGSGYYPDDFPDIGFWSDDDRLAVILKLVFPDAVVREVMF